MRRQTQAFRHDPVNGIYGDCFRTAIACLLDLDRDDVPHEHREFEDGEQSKLMRVWLRKRGLTLIEIGYLAEGWPDLPNCLSDMWMVCGEGCRFLVGGRSPRGFDHVVVASTAGVLHDPHPDGTGLVGPCADGRWWITFIGKAV